MSFISYKSSLMRSSIEDWWPIMVGFFILYIPTFYDLFNGLWANEEQAHGPIILFLSLWLIYRQWQEMIKRSEGYPTSFMGWPILFLTLLFYIIGRSQQILIFEIGSFITAFRVSIAVIVVLISIIVTTICISVIILHIIAVFVPISLIYFFPSLSFISLILSISLTSLHRF